MTSDGRRRYAERVRLGMREAVMEAVERLVLDRGWQATRMTDVAELAGVSRQSLYQLFGSREALAQEYVLYEADRFLRSVEQAVRGRPDDPVAATAAALDVFLTDAAESAVIKAALGGTGTGSAEGAELLPLVTTRGLPVLETAVERLTGVVGELWPGFRDEDVRLFSESVVRLAISHLTTPSSGPERATEDVTRLLTPFIREAQRRAGA